AMNIGKTVTWNLPEVLKDELVFDRAILGFLEQDLNTPKALQYLHGLAKKVIDTGDAYSAQELSDSMSVLGLRYYPGGEWFHGSEQARPFAADIEFNLLQRLE